MSGTPPGASPPIEYEVDLYSGDLVPRKRPAPPPVAAPILRVFLRVGCPCGGDWAVGEQGATIIAFHHTQEGQRARTWTFESWALLKAHHTQDLAKACAKMIAQLRKSEVHPKNEPGKTPKGR